MNATIDTQTNELVIRLPIITPPRPSTSGKTLIVATTGGNQSSTATINGKVVTIGCNAYIKP